MLGHQCRVYKFRGTPNSQKWSFIVLNLYVCSCLVNFVDKANVSIRK